MKIEYDADKPTLKNNVNEKLIISGMTEDVNYIFKGYKNTDLIYSNEHLNIGETISLIYDFKPYENGYFAYEKLSLIAYRQHKVNGKNSINNFVKRFHSLQEAEFFISGIEFEIDRQYAFNKLVNLYKEIQKIKDDYSI